MTPDEKKQFLEELEENYFLVKKHSVLYMLGGAIAAAVAILGINYATTKSMIDKSASAKVHQEIKAILFLAQQDGNEISEILAASKSAVAYLPERMSALERSTSSHRRALESFADQFSGRLGYLYVKGQYRDPQVEATAKSLENAAKQIRESLSDTK
ncbi:MAG: hypothetical protein ABW080_16960 [Candidatus Thiodiazotropha sp.]